MNEVSLFSGGGGGLLGSKLIGSRFIAYVESDPYCQQLINQRINDGILENAPIFTDVRKFLFSGAAEQYRGFADLVSAGFPCQPFSVAGKRLSEFDARNMWPATIGIIRAIKPRFCFLENVPGLLSVDNPTNGFDRYIYTIFRDLAEAGYNAKWCLLGADDCGAPHRRKRLWIFCYLPNNNIEAIRIKQELIRGLTEANKLKHNGNHWNVANTESERIQRFWSCWQQESYPYDGKTISLRGSERSKSTNWEVEPDLDRVVNGLANRMDRIRLLGNGQVPTVVANAYLKLKNYKP